MQCSDAVGQCADAQPHWRACSDSVCLPRRSAGRTCSVCLESVSGFCLSAALQHWPDVLRPVATFLRKALGLFEETSRGEGMQLLVQEAAACLDTWRRRDSNSANAREARSVSL
jgi:hypothetical protein